jgi:hypothetical protein
MRFEEYFCRVKQIACSLYLFKVKVKKMYLSIAYLYIYLNMVQLSSNLRYCWLNTKWGFNQMWKGVRSQYSSYCKSNLLQSIQIVSMFSVAPKFVQFVILWKEQFSFAKSLTNSVVEQWGNMQLRAGAFDVHQFEKGKLAIELSSIKISTQH